MDISRQNVENFHSSLHFSSLTFELSVQCAVTSLHHYLDICWITEMSQALFNIEIKSGE